jgi:hypothetical protein
MPALGVGRHVRILGVMELSHDALKANPFIPIVLLWIGAFARDRSIFF